MKAICIDASNRPSKVPENEWVVEGEVYTITRVVRMGLQDNKFGVKQSVESFPYELYDSERFLPLDLLSQAFEETKETVKEADLELI